MVLNSQNEGALESFVATVSDPVSTQYDHFLKPSAFASRFGGTSSAIGLVSSYFKKYGATVSAPWSGGLVLSITGSRSDLSRALGVGFHTVTVGSKGRYLEASSSISLPNDVSAVILGTVGLYPDGNFPSGRRHLTHPRLVHLGKGPRSTSSSRGSQGLARPCTSGIRNYEALGSYLPSQIASLYGYGSLYARHADGQGVTLAVPEFTNPLVGGSNGSFARHLAFYDACFGVTGRVTYTQVDGGSGNASKGNIEEASLDVETLQALAPRANVIVYSATQADSDAMFLKMVSDNRASIIVSSWGSCESDTSPTDLSIERLTFLEAAAQGQSVLSASGDQGSADCFNNGSQHQLAVDDPASQPVVTGVGGTQYATSLSANAVPVAWNDSTYFGGTGGGVSNTWIQPSYQSAVATNDIEAVQNCTLKPGCRLVPDVSALAEGFLVYTPSYNWDVIGGTSGATPTFAAGIALVESANHHRLGLLNPTLYALYAAQPTAFVDVTRGNNDYLHRHGGLYHAMVGYDVASGLGTLRLPALRTYLLAHG